MIYGPKGGQAWTPDGWGAIVVVERGLTFGYFAWYRPIVLRRAWDSVPNLEQLRGETQDARRQGIVIVEATISPGGCVSHAKVLRSVATDLDVAAVRAVTDWAFTPTLLDGVPVPVIMTVTVQFSLQ